MHSVIRRYIVYHLYLHTDRLEGNVISAGYWPAPNRWPRMKEILCSLMEMLLECIPVSPINKGLQLFLRMIYSTALVFHRSLRVIRPHNFAGGTLNY